MPALDPSGPPRLVSEACVRIPLPDPFVPGVTAVFAIGPAGSRWLVDTGADTEESEAALRTKLGSLGMTPEASRVLLTHTHLDHAGGLLRFAPSELAAHSLAVEEMRRADPKSSRGPEALRRMGVDEDAITSLAPGGEPVAEPPFRATRIDHTLQGTRGMVPDSGGWWWYLAEGHAPGHLVLFHPDTGTLLAGDQFLEKWKTPLIVSDPGFDSLGAYLASIRTARELAPERICSSHMETMENPMAWLARTEQAITSRLERVLGALSAAKAPMSAEEVLADLYPGTGDGPLRIVFLREMLAMLRHLASSGRSVGAVENGVERYRVR